jgi:hypothetical protein
MRRLWGIPTTKFDVLPHYPEGRIRHCALCITFFNVSETDHGTVGGNEGHGFVPEQQRAWSMRHETVFSCARPTISCLSYLMRIAIIYAGCLR